MCICLFKKWQKLEERTEKLYAQIDNLEKKKIMKRSCTVHTGWSENSHLLSNPHKHTTQHTDQTNCCWLAFFTILQQITPIRKSTADCLFTRGLTAVCLRSSTAPLPEQPDRLVYGTVSELKQRALCKYTKGVSSNRVHSASSARSALCLKMNDAVRKKETESFSLGGWEPRCHEWTGCEWCCFWPAALGPLHLT